jgi:hypothetical protein
MNAAGSDARSQKKLERDSIAPSGKTDGGENVADETTLVVQKKYVTG